MICISINFCFGSPRHYQFPIIIVNNCIKYIESLFPYSTDYLTSFLTPFRQSYAFFDILILMFEFLVPCKLSLLFWQYKQKSIYDPHSFHVTSEHTFYPSKVLFKENEFCENVSFSFVISSLVLLRLISFTGVSFSSGIYSETELLLDFSSYRCTERCFVRMLHFHSWFLHY